MKTYYYFVLLAGSELDETLYLALDAYAHREDLGTLGSRFKVSTKEAIAFSFVPSAEKRSAFSIFPSAEKRSADESKRLLETRLEETGCSWKQFDIASVIRKILEE